MIGAGGLGGEANGLERRIVAPPRGGDGGFELGVGFVGLFSSRIGRGRTLRIGALLDVFDKMPRGAHIAHSHAGQKHRGENSKTQGVFGERPTAPETKEMLSASSGNMCLASGIRRSWDMTPMENATGICIASTPQRSFPLPS